MKKLAAIVAVMVVMGGNARASEGDTRLPETVIPVEQSIDLTLDPAQLDYTGRVTVTLHITAATELIAIHAMDQTFKSIALKQGDKTIALADKVVGPQHHLKPTSGAKLDAGTYQLDIQFAGKQSTQSIGLYRALADGLAYSLTQFEADYARMAFPCFDEPGAKIPYQVTVRVPKALSAVSNTLVAKETIEGDKKIVSFKKTPPLPSYLLALAVGPLDAQVIEGMGVPGRVYTARGKAPYAKEIANVSAPIVASLEKYFGRKYPYDKLDFIAAPEFLYGGMENPGAIVYRDSRILLRPEEVTPMTRNRLVELTGHEVAHIWFGDLVTMKWWDDLWLNESFASWMEPKVMDDVVPDLRAGLNSVASTDIALRTDSRRTTRAIRRAVAATDNFENLVDELTYNKGQAVLEMFESYLGRAKFHAGVVAYINAFAWKSTTADDLWQKLGEATGVDVKKAMSTFLDQSGAPLITIKVLGKGRVRIEQRRLGPGAPTRWIVPIVLKYSDGHTVNQKTVLLDQPAEEVEIGKLAWVHPNADERGYYRWIVPSETLTALLANATQELSVRERLGLISNTAALARLGFVDSAQLIGVLQKLTDDPDPRVQMRVVGALTELNEVLAGTRIASAYAEWAQKLVAKIRGRIAAQPADTEKPDDINLRGSALFGACELGDETALAAGRAALDQYLANPKSLHASLVNAAFGCSAISADRARFDSFKQHFEKSETPLDRERFLAALRESRAFLGEFLQYTLKGPLRPQEIIRALRYTPPREQATIYAFVKDHYAELAPRIPEAFRSTFAGQIAPRCDTALSKDARAFFTDAKRKVVGIDEALDQAEDEVVECVAMRTKHLADIERAIGSGKPAAPTTTHKAKR